LVVAPEKRLSWQYHFRRAEIWTVVAGPVGVAISDSDEQGEVGTYQPDDFIKLAQGERHRLIGQDAWGLLPRFGNIQMQTILPTNLTSSDSKMTSAVNKFNLPFI